MTEEISEEKTIHHEQQLLCTTRLPYRQGRKLTAVKVYTINNESNHLLIFGVPSLNLRQELKSLFVKFGKLKQFGITKQHQAEVFTETYHAVFEQIRAARVAKKFLDTKNFYGGSLHICYAPELEMFDETRSKILKRQQDVLNRLRNIQKEVDKPKNTEEKNYITEKFNKLENTKLNMGEVNVIGVGKQIRDVVFKKNKRKLQREPSVVIEKQFKPTKHGNKNDCDHKSTIVGRNSSNIVGNGSNIVGNNSETEVIDFYSTQKETISNIDEALNYNKFGNEVIRKVPQKPMNIIKFNIFNKK